MRTSLLFLLLSCAAGPALAADESDDRAARREAARAERAEANEGRVVQRSPRSRAERPESENVLENRGGDRPDVQVQKQEVVRQRMAVRRPPGDEADGPPRPTLEQRREAVDTVREWRGPGRFRQVSPEVVEQHQEAVDTVRDGRAPGQFRQVTPTVVERSSPTVHGALREHRPQRAEPLEMLGGRRAPVVSRIPREGTQPPLRASSRPTRQTAYHWRGDWRSDRRYDWREHRRRHRSLFRFGFYVDPFGWRYRPYSIGWRMWPHYYRSSYWLIDPWRYRLPYAPPGYRWIRYYDDLLLVDTWDGQVVDVIYDFFW